MSLPNEPVGPLAVLRYRDFRLLWVGQVLSMIGSRMQGAALLWHLYALTGSPYALGAIGLVRVIPLVTFALIGGVVADALDRRRLMLISQSIMALLAAGLGTWSLLGLRHPWPIYVVAGLNAATIAFDGPARQSMVVTLVPRERLAQAVSLNSMSSQLASVIGPALAGLVIAQHSVGQAYLVNAASFLAVIVALLAMRPPAKDAEDLRPAISLPAVLEGLRFMRRSRLLVSLMLLDFVATFFASANSLLPVFATRILHVGPTGYGWLAAASAVGSLAGALGMALAPPIRRQGAVVLWAVFAYGLATVAFGLSQSFAVSFLALAGTGAADTVSTVLRQTIRQLVTPDALRGRMTSINMIFFQGGPQLGEMEAGLVAGWRGAPFSVVSGGIACLLTVGAVVVRAPWLRRYRGVEVRE
ncbi:MAG: MFS transporter [Armatimonadetes bacterium]|nr:MFS transporter [Armatimonadota bacterium]